MTEIKGNGFFTLNNNVDGILTVIGTDTVQFASLLAEAPSGRCYVTGTLLNLTPQEFNLKIVGLGTEASTFLIPAYAGIKFTKMPMQQIRIAVNGTVRLSALGFIVDPVPSDDINGHTMLNVNSGLFIEKEAGRIKLYDLYDEQTLNTATTDSLAPTSGKTLRIRSISIAVDDAQVVIVKWDSSAGGDKKPLIKANFGGTGSAFYDFGEDGLVSPHGVNGKLEILTEQAIQSEIYITYRED